LRAKIKDRKASLERIGRIKQYPVVVSMGRKASGPSSVAYRAIEDGPDVLGEKASVIFPGTRPKYVPPFAG